MPAPPSEVRVVESLQGVRFILPSHRLLRLFGGVPLLLGCVFCGAAAFDIIRGVLLCFGPGGAPRGIPFSLSSVLFIVIGLPMINFGIPLALGRPEFEVRGERFRAGPRFGPFRRSKWRPVEDLEHLEINLFGSTDSKVAMHVLRAHVGEAKPLNITGSKDRAWLEQLASSISATLDRAELFADAPQVITRDRNPDDEVKDRHPDVIPAGAGDPGPPPSTSKLWIEQSPTGPTIFIPPRGMGGKPVPGLLLFVVIWLAATNGGGAVFGAAFLRGSGFGWLDMLFVGGILALFESVGVGILLFALSLARRRAILDVTDHGRMLMVTRSGLRKSSQREIAATDITAIQVQDSGTSLNDQPLRQVSINVAGDDDVKLLTGAKEADLTWLARALRHALAPTPVEADDPGESLVADGARATA